MNEDTLCKLIFGIDWRYYVNPNYIIMLDLGTEHIRLKNYKCVSMKAIKHSFLPELLIVHGNDQQNLVINSAPITSGLFIDIPYTIYPKPRPMSMVAGYTGNVMDVSLYQMNEHSSIIKTSTNSYFAFNDSSSIKDLLLVFYDESLYDSLIIGIVKQENYKMKKITDKKFIDDTADVYELNIPRRSTPKLNIVISDDSLLIKSRSYVIDKINAYNLHMNTHDRLGSMYTKPLITSRSENCKYLAVTNKPYEETEYILFDNYDELMMHIVPSPDWFNVVFSYNNEISPIKLPLSRIYPYSVIVGFKYSLANMFSLLLQIKHVMNGPFKIWLRRSEYPEWVEPYNQYNYIMKKYKVEYDEELEEFKPNKFLRNYPTAYKRLHDDSNYYCACLDMIHAFGFSTEEDSIMLIISHGNVCHANQLVDA